MADKYGNDADFLKIMEEFNRKCGNSSSNVQVPNQGSTINSTQKLARTYPHPDSKVAKEFDKSSWEYWEKHARKKVPDSDGRKVMVYQGDTNDCKTKMVRKGAYNSK